MFNYIDLIKSLPRLHNYGKHTVRPMAPMFPVFGILFEKSRGFPTIQTGGWLGVGDFWTIQP